MWSGIRFCEEDIDQILERRAHVIQLESEGKGSTFSKVSRLHYVHLTSCIQFVCTCICLCCFWLFTACTYGCVQASFVADGSSDISIDDPDFWQKWAERAKLNLEELANKVSKW